jgi:hypothetical protein
MYTFTDIICHLTSFHVQKLYEYKSRDSSVGIALGYELDDRGSRVRFPARAGNFSLHHRVQNGFGAHPASYPMGTRGSFPGGKAAGTWSSTHLHLVPRSKKEWSYTFTPQIRLHDVVLSLEKSTFTFTLSNESWRWSRRVSRNYAECGRGLVQGTIPIFASKG